LAWYNLSMQNRSPWIHQLRPDRPNERLTDDIETNVAIIGAGFITAYAVSAWPDLIVGICIAAMNSDAAREVWKAAREEHRAALA